MNATPGGSTRSDWLMEQAESLQRGGHRMEAIETLREALANDSAQPQAWYMLGYLLRQQGEFQSALDAYSKALLHGVAHPEEVELNRAVIFADYLRRDEEALAALQRSLEFNPAYLPALLNLGNLHEEYGRREEALAAYARAMEIPDAKITANAELKSEALARSVQLQPPASVDDPVFAQLEQATTAVSGTTPGVRANLQFAAGRAYDRLRDWPKAFDAFARANRHLQRESGRRHDPAAVTAEMNAIIAAFPVPDRSAGGIVDSQPAPLLVCGMFRSGSTLVEQVLSTHTRVTAGGELEVLMREVSTGEYAPFPASIHGPRDDRDARVARRYLAALAERFPDSETCAYVTDKRPDNYLLIGLAKRLFPHLRIIHTVRDPMDVGLSIYMHHLTPQVAPYSMDLAAIGHTMAEQERLMAHWQAIFDDDIHTFDYDAFVREPESQLAPLFAFLGLDANVDEALEFHAQGNAVKTASYWQVRQPLYKHASGRWRRYGRLLDPLRDAYLKAGGSRFSDVDQA